MIAIHNLTGKPVTVRLTCHNCGKEREEKLVKYFNACGLTCSCGTLLATFYETTQIRSSGGTAFDPPDTR